MNKVSQKRIDLLQYYAENGRNLRDVLHLVGLVWSSALRICRRHNIYFPDHKRRRTAEND